jgi:integrative and conjugative element protein (TIGR02256 family)
VPRVQFHESWVDQSNGQFIVLQKSVITFLKSKRQFGERSTEKGGVLLGYRRGPHVEILIASPPHSADVKSRFSFLRRDPQHQALATSQWRKSNGLVHHVGEWHTHPQSFPQPSVIDERNWQKLALERHPDWVVGVIVGRVGLWVGKVSNVGMEPFVPA